MKKFLSFLLVTLLPLVASAESLDEDGARYAVAEFFSSSPQQSSRLRAQGQQLKLRSNGHEKGYYIFDRPEGGVVFVADDDAIGRTVLGYTDQGSFDAENLPVGLQDWLYQVGVLMDAVHEGKINKSNAQRKAGSIVVDALIQTRWSQRAPYYNLCPMSNGQRCLTGCTATAMAQVLKYWEWPKHGYLSVSYYDERCGQTLNLDLSTSYYDWDNMLNSYSYDYSSAQATAVATLMRDCGYAVQMNYSPNASSAWVSVSTMQDYFHYSADAKDRRARDFYEDVWHGFIQQDLRAGRPVLYTGYEDEGTGHEFILDGYDTGGYYHVNWGWGGSQDGWFMLTNLNGYNNSQRMINNLKPDYNDDSNIIFADAKIDGIYYKFSGNEATVTYLKYQDSYPYYYSDYSGIVVIPSTVTYKGKTYIVTSIGNYAFYGCSALTDIYCYADNVIETSNDAFYNSSISSATLHVPAGLLNSYKTIAPWSSFKAIVPIENIDFADANVKAICVENWDTDGDGELSEKEAAAVKSLGTVFQYNTQIESFKELRFFPCLTTISDWAFNGCINLTSITIPNSVTNIGNYAFYECTSLTTITIPNKVTSIGAYAFSVCTDLVSIKVESGNSVYDSRNNCNAIIETASNTLIFGCTNTVIPDNMTSIRWGAFYGCSSLVSITIPNKVTSIGSYAFSNCNSLSYINIPNSVTKIGQEAFYGCSLNNIYCLANNVPQTELDAFNSSSIRSATLHVPAGSVNSYKTTEPWSSFKSIVPIENINFADANVKAICVANWDTNHDGELNEAEVSAVTNLGEVFKGNKKISTFNELQYFTGLTSIGNYAFSGCSSLVAVTLPNSVTSIGNEVFYNCSSLTSITIPNSVKSFGWYAFSYCI